MPSLDYDPGTVYLTLDRVSFGNAATSANQRALTSLLDPRVDNPPAALVPVYDALFDATNAQAPVYLNQLSGDALAAFPAIAQDDARGFTQGLRARALGQPAMPLAALSNRVQLAFAGEGLNGLLAQASGTASAEPTGAAARPGDWKGWVSVAGTRNRARGNGNGAGFSADAAALQAGLEKSFDAHARIGAALGYTDTRADADDSRNASGKVKSVSAGVYGGYDTGRWFANAALAYSSQGVDTRRNLAFMGSTATASYTANTWSAWSEVGPHLGYGRVSIDPSLSLSVMQTRQPEYAESGSPAALRVDGTTYNSRRIGAGVRLSAQEHALAATVKPDVSIRYEREVGDTGLNLTQQLSGLGPYTVRSTELGRDIVTLGVGLTTQVKRELTLFGRIDAAWRKNQNALALQVGLQYRWYGRGWAARRLTVAAC
jgi:outer membrane autotransporter protein